MKNLWDADFIIDEQSALQIIQAQFPILKANKILPMGLGWDNTAFLVNDEIIFRFPRRRLTIDLIAEENKLLPELQKKLCVAIPKPIFFGEPSKLFPCPFMGYKIISGQTACSLNFTFEEKSSLIEPLAIFLKQLHAISINEFPQKPVKDHFYRIDPVLMLQKLEKNLNQLQELEKVSQVSKVLNFFRRSVDGVRLQEKALTHGDLYSRHILVDDMKNLVGIIDWGNIHFGFLANDIALVYNFFPQELHDQFFAIYGEVSADTIKVACLRAYLTGTFLILFGHFNADYRLEQEGLKILKRLHERIKF